MINALVGDGRGAPLAALKALALFLTAVALFRITERRTLAELAPFDFVTAVAVGAVIGRTATAADTSFLTGAAALVTLLVAHSVVSRLRFLPGMTRLVDPPVRTLIRDGQVQRANLRQCGLTEQDLQGILRQHGMTDPSEVGLAVFEAKGAVSILAPGRPPEPTTRD